MKILILLWCASGQSKVEVFKKNSKLMENKRLIIAKRLSSFYHMFIDYYVLFIYTNNCVNVNNY